MSKEVNPGEQTQDKPKASPKESRDTIINEQLTKIFDRLDKIDLENKASKDKIEMLEGILAAPSKASEVKCADLVTAVNHLSERIGQIQIITTRPLPTESKTLPPSQPPMITIKTEGWIDSVNPQGNVTGQYRAVDTYPELVQLIKASPTKNEFGPLIKQGTAVYYITGNGKWIVKKFI